VTAKRSLQALARRLRGRWFKTGARLTVTVTKPGAFIGAVKTLTVAKKRTPSIGTRCLPPGATKSVGC
jgi:hypothetical protein